MGIVIVALLGAGYLGALIGAAWERYAQRSRIGFTSMAVLGVVFIIAANIATERRGMTASIAVIVLAMAAHAVILLIATIRYAKTTYWLLQVICTCAVMIGMAGLIVGRSMGTPSERQDAEFEPRFTALTQAVKRCVEQLPPTRKLPQAPLPNLDLEPKPTGENIAYASAEGLRDPKWAPDERLSNVFGLGVEWSALLHKWRAPDERMPDRLAERAAGYEKLLGTRYLVVIRVLRWEEPVVKVAEQHYVPGRAEAEVFLFSLEEPRLLASFPLSVSGESVITFGAIAGTYFKAEESAAHSLRSRFREGIESQLKQMTADWPQSK